jgi:hypothetical protein
MTQKKRPLKANYGIPTIVEVNPLLMDHLYTKPLSLSKFSSSHSNINLP